jgi:hypothetical protein
VAGQLFVGEFEDCHDGAVDPFDNVIGTVTALPGQSFWYATFPVYETAVTVAMVANIWAPVPDPFAD